MIDFLVTYGAQIVLVLFMTVFFAFGFWAYRPANKKRMENYGEIPFKESLDGNE